ncbi:MAG TPA: aminotransferase class III-fold pyridoxal phosphate-dependent enzyme [Acidimicrobiales bacterium]|nr:aminotransferase class III-fold pyridoxal phosphate-dependent enzyme [Acidimicrobiales bacterium]
MTLSPLAQRDAAHLIHPVTSPRQMASSGPRIVVEADGFWLTDDKGNRIIDGFAGLWCVAVGHGRRRIIDAVADQLSRLDYFTTFHGNSHPLAIELAERIAAQFPPELGLNHVMFASGGSEANETNFKLIRMYWALRGEERRKTIVARHHGYHGLTIATMTATGIMPMHWNFGPEAAGFAHIAAPYCMRCELGLRFPDCALACACTLEEYVEREGPDTVAAFIAEPVIGAGGIIPPPPGYFEEIRRICDRHGILFVSDEVVCGFGRTGKRFGFQHYGTAPDIVTLAKGLTSGYQPLGASVVSEEVWTTIAERLPDRMPFSHGFTYSGHPAACAAALANLAIVDEEDLVSKAAADGAYLLEQLRTLERFDTVGQVRGLGLMCGIEFVADKASGRGFSNPHEACEMVEHEAWARGLYCRAMGIEVVGLAPPLVMDRPTIDRMVEILGDSIEAMEAALLPGERARAAKPAVVVGDAAEFFAKVLPSRIDPDATCDLEVTVQFDLSGEGGGIWLLEIDHGTVHVEKLDTRRSDVSATICATAADFLKILSGELSGADAFISQQLAVDGDLDAAASLIALGVL